MTNFKFNVGDKCLALFGNPQLLYESKIIKREARDNECFYFVHYTGWNAKWDEWRTEDFLYEINDENTKKQKQLQEQVKKGKSKKPVKSESVKSKTTEESKSAADNEVVAPESTKKSKSEERTVTVKEEKTDVDAKKSKLRRSKDTFVEESSESNELVSTEAEAKTNKTKEAKLKDDKIKKEPAAPPKKVEKARGEKRSAEKDVVAPVESAISVPAKKKRKPDTGPDSNINNESTPYAKSLIIPTELRIEIPEDLRPVLIDDWDLITRQKQLVDLPASLTVNTILDEYVHGLDKDKDDLLIQVVYGIKDFFSAMLGVKLLYKFERPQYSDLLEKHTDRSMCDIYGAEHLLRFFVRLDLVLSQTTLSGDHIKNLMPHLNTVLDYIKCNQSRLFNISHYVTPNQDYLRRTLN